MQIILLHPQTSVLKYPNVLLQILDWHIDLSDPDSEVDKRLKGHMIDLFINLPSKNKFRRPASFMSRGYLTRRIAVDFSVPLITNVKCAKLFVESLAYMRTKREICQHDIRGARKTRVLPGLIDVHVHLRDPGSSLFLYFYQKYLKKTPSSC